MLARPHPCFGDWCFAATGYSQRLLYKQLSFRDKALAEDPNFSGMPPEFEQWCRTSWLPANLGRDYYRKQAEAHVACWLSASPTFNGPLKKRPVACLMNATV